MFTPDDLACRIVRHFKPSGSVLEPCRGGGAFERALCGELNIYCDWCEITDGSDFLTAELTHYDYIVTNPPYSKFRAFLNRSMEVADNVVFLANLNVWMTKCRLREMEAAGFGIVEMLLVDTPPKPWRSSGFQLGATWIRRGWKGGITISR